VRRRSAIPRGFLLPVRLRRATVLCLAVGVWVTLPPPATHAQNSQQTERTYENVGEVLSSWQVYIETLRDLPQEERVRKSLAFFGWIPWEQICDWCSEGSPGVADPEEESALEQLVDSKLRASAPDVNALADLLTNPDIVAACQRAAVRYISRERERFVGRPEAKILAEAFLMLADSGEPDGGIRFSLERGAICLWASDELMRRMLTHCRSGDRMRMEQGVTMLGQSRDERAADSLVAFVEELAEAGTHPWVLGKALTAAAKTCGPRAFDAIEGIWRTAPDSTLRRAALIALSRTGDWRVHSILLAEYGDSESGIADSTHASTDRRGFYWDLWLMTRLAEEGLIRALREGNDREVALTLQLLDRESRFGRAATGEDLYRALEEVAQSAGEAEKDKRIRQILERFRSYPEPPAVQAAGQRHQ